MLSSSRKNLPHALVKTANASPMLPHMRGLFDKLDVQDNSADIVTWILGPHELFCAPKDCGELGEVDGAYAEIYRVLKPGGKFIALDHVASGTDEAIGGALHRIPPAKHYRTGEKGGACFRENQRHPLRTKLMTTPSMCLTQKFAARPDRFLHMYTKPE